jgi:predicted deacylase
MYIREIKGRYDGPTLAVLGAVHGNERCGADAIAKADVTLLHGRVIFLICNEEALAADERFIDKDLNRSFGTQSRQTREDRLARDIEKHLDMADAMLDLHASIAESSPFAICGHHSISVARRLPITRILTNIDEFHSGSTDWYMNRQGKVGICVECGHLRDPGASRIAQEAIRCFLASYGMIDETVQEKDMPVFRAKSVYRTESEFTLARPFADFEIVRRGTMIGTDSADIYSEEDFNILFARSGRGECFMRAVELSYR